MLQGRQRSAATEKPLATGKKTENRRLFPRLRRVEAGFSLVEIIMVLILLGLIGAMVGIGVLQITKGFVFSRENAETAGKAQLAIMRIARELTALRQVSSASSSSISFTSIHDGWVNKDYTLSLSGTNLTLNDGTHNDVLVDNISGFSLAFYDTYNGSPSSTWTTTKKIIEVSFTITGAEGIASTFSTEIAPRNL